MDIRQGEPTQLGYFLEWVYQLFMLLCGKCNAHFSGSLKKRCGNKRLVDLSPAYPRFCLRKAGKTTAFGILVSPVSMMLRHTGFCLFFKQ